MFPSVSQAVIYYTESLKSDDVQTQHGSCLALKCLKVVKTLRNGLSTPTAEVSPGSVCVCVFQATESVDHITDMCRVTDGALRSAARETVLSFGTNTSNFPFICILST